MPGPRFGIKLNNTCNTLLLHYQYQEKLSSLQSLQRPKYRRTVLAWQAIRALLQLLSTATILSICKQLESREAGLMGMAIWNCCCRVPSMRWQARQMPPSAPTSGPKPTRGCSSAPLNASRTMSAEVMLDSALRSKLPPGRNTTSGY